MTLSPPELPAQSRLGRLGAPALWGLLAFAVFYHYAQFVDKVGWNAIEMVIAQKLTGHGVYATSLDYASAVAWRPVLPTLAAAILRFWTEDPIRIIQLACGLSFASLVSSMYLSGRLLGNGPTGHLAAFATLVCPGVSTQLIQGIHAWSHIVMLGFLGPAIHASLSLIAATAGEPAPRLRRYLLTGLLWGLAYLCRAELMFFFGVFLVVLLGQAWGKRGQYLPLLAALGVFLLFFVPYNLYASRVTERDGTLIRKTIYGFYISQGWADPDPAAPGQDTEGEGYVYAKRLYGEPKENGESLLRAILRNPAALWHRLATNAGNFYPFFFDRNFMAPWLGASALALVGLLLTGALAAKDRPPAVFLLGMFAAAHFVLMFHIDIRYLTIACPPVILAAIRPLHLGWQAGRRLLPRVPRGAWVVVAVGLLAYVSREQVQVLLPKGAPNHPGVEAMRAFGVHFRAAVKQPHLVKNNEPHVVLVFLDSSTVPREDEFLLPYFCQTALVMRKAEGEFPRGKIYSYRDCEDDYVYVPAELRLDPRFRSGRMISEFDNPVMGRYCLFEMH